MAVHTKSVNQITFCSHLNVEEQEKLFLLGVNDESIQSMKKVADILLPFKREIMDHVCQSIGAREGIRELIGQDLTEEPFKTELGQYLEQWLKGTIDQEHIHSCKKFAQQLHQMRFSPEQMVLLHHWLNEFMVTTLMERLRYRPKQLRECMLALQQFAAFNQQLILSVYFKETMKPHLIEFSDILSQTTEVDTMRKLVTTMKNQMRDTESVTAATEEMSQSFQEVANHAVNVADGTAQAVHSTEKSQQIVKEAVAHIEQVGKLYQQVEEQVNRLNQEIHNIKEVIMIINNIAEQTNLLALNASIEAARAGEMGKGFSVVAAEIRKLSDHTKEQISKISTNMESLLTVSNQVTEKIHQTGQLVENSVKGAHFTEEELRSILSTMETINESIANIAAMSQEQTSVTNDIACRSASIHEQSIQCQDIANKTANMILELSKKMEDFRLNLLNLNLNLSSKEMITIAITDHLLWKWRVYNMILGIETIESVASHHECRLGRWYDHEQSPTIRNYQEFIALAKPHEEVHRYAQVATQCFKEGNMAGVLAAAEQLEKASNTVVDLLRKLEKKM